ncbi:hypothetical protein EMIT0196MI5_170115 [Pseudomonas sp. IT-196MI5]
MWITQETLPLSIIRFENVDVIFAARPKPALDLLDQGFSRPEILQKTGLIVGVEKANLEINKGEICVLMGLSGSGKSSLLRCINGLNTVSRGKLFVEHEGRQIDIASCTPAELKMMRTQRIAMVFQKFALMPWLTVRENISFGLEMQGRALAMDADILLMDEPFCALDPLIRQGLQDELLDLQRKLHKTIVFVSHDLDEALKLGTCIAIMKDGKIIQYSKPEEIVLNPADDYVRNIRRPHQSVECAVREKLDDSAGPVRFRPRRILPGYGSKPVDGGESAASFDQRSKRRHARARPIMESDRTNRNLGAATDLRATNDHHARRPADSLRNGPSADRAGRGRYRPGHIGRRRTVPGTAGPQPVVSCAF